MGEVIVITSGKGGVGKTTVTANLSVSLSLLGKKVIAIDTDIGLRNLDVVMGLENSIVYNIVDVIEGNCRLKQAIIRDKRFRNLYLLPSAQSKDKSCINQYQMINLTNELKQKFDYVLIDCPAGIEQGFKNAIAGATRAIIVTTPEVSAIRDADRVSCLLDKAGLYPINLIVNKIRNDLVKKGDMMSTDDVTEILSLDLIGMIHDDTDIVISTNRGEPLAGANSYSSKIFMNIAKRIDGEEVPMLNHKNRKFNFFKKYLTFRKRKRSGKIAHDRLKILLVSDRAGCSPETMELIKNDILNVISKYVEIDKENCKIQIEKDKKPYLFANIPIKEVKV